MVSNAAKSFFFGPEMSATNASEIRPPKFEGALCAFALWGPVFDIENGTNFGITLVPTSGAIIWSVFRGRKRVAAGLLRSVCKLARESITTD